MTGLGSSIARSFVGAAAAWWLVSGGPVRGQDSDFWDRPPGGFWELGANWLDGSAPGITDRATFDVAASIYLVEFGTAPSAIRELNVTDGNVTFNSPGTFRTLNVTSTLLGGPQNVNISHASLTLGTVDGFSIMPLHLTVGNTLFMHSGGFLDVRFGSDVITSRLDSSGNILVTGFGSALTAGSTTFSGGSLNVTSGGVVQTGVATLQATSLSVTGGSVVQSAGATLDGTSLASVGGAGSQWNISLDMILGGIQGSGTLDIRDGGSVSCANGFLGSFGSATATIIDGASWTMTGQRVQ